MGNTDNDLTNSYNWCAALSRDPSPQGIHNMMDDAYWSVRSQNQSDYEAKDAVVDGLLYATWYTCPQYGYVVRNAFPY